MALSDVALQMIAILFVLVAFAAAFATLGASPTVRRITNWVIYGCGVGALASVMLAAWFLFSAAGLNFGRLPAPTTRGVPAGLTGGPQRARGQLGRIYGRCEE